MGMGKTFKDIDASDDSARVFVDQGKIHFCIQCQAASDVPISRNEVDSVSLWHQLTEYLEDSFF